MYGRSRYGKSPRRSRSYGRRNKTWGPGYRPKSFRRSAGRWWNRRRANTRVTLPDPVTSDIMVAKLKYNLNTAFTNAALTISHTEVWRGNSAYDPEFATGGKQPIGYDQWKAFYQYCHVTGSKISVNILQGSDAVMQFALFPQSTSDSPDTMLKELRSLPYAKCATSGKYNQPGNTRIKLTNYMSSAKMFCVSKQEIKDNPVFGHATNTNPANTWYWLLTGAVQGGGAVNPMSFTYDVEITYYVVFKRRQFISDIAMEGDPDEEGNEQ